MQHRMINRREGSADGPIQQRMGAASVHQGTTVIKDGDYQTTLDK
jgi:hypothetical protein